MSVATARDADAVRAVLPWAALVTLEVALVAAYAAAAPATVTEPRYVAYPLVWLTVGLWALATVDPPDRPRRVRVAAGALAAGYLLVLAVLDGTVGLGSGAGVHGSVVWLLPPGWGPAVTGGVGPVSLALFPYRVVGDLALAWLVYAAATRSGLVGGLVGLATCVGCTLPVLAAVAGAVVPAASTAAVGPWAYDLSTAAFVVAVALLVRGVHNG